jgi:Fic family protein
MPEVDVRSIQRALGRLNDLGLVQRSGAINNPSSSIKYANLLVADIPTKLLEDEDRPESSFNRALLDWLSRVSPHELVRIIDQGTKSLEEQAAQSKMSPKELEYLTIELSWKSSALEGNTYTLLDTQLLLTEGIKAKNRTEFETQMVLNHKNAIGFIVENPTLFSGKITLTAVKELHKIIGNNLGIAKGVRKRLVRISASNYIPLANPYYLRENADQILEIISQQTNATLKSLLALSLIPYLQIFEDGNKRTGRMLANAILISTIGRGFSMRSVSARELALAYLAFYEFNSMKLLSKIVASELSSN